MFTAMLILTVALPIGQTPVSDTAPAAQPASANGDTPPARPSPPGQWGPPGPRMPSSAMMPLSQLLDGNRPAGPGASAERIPVATSGPIVQASARETDNTGPALPTANPRPMPITTVPSLQEATLPVPDPATRSLPPPARRGWTDERPFSGLGWAIVATPAGATPVPAAASAHDMKPADPPAPPAAPLSLPPVSNTPAALAPPAPAATSTPARLPEPARTIASTEADTAPPASASPLIRLETTGPATITQGKPLTYEIVARNQGTVPAAHVRIEEELPAGSRFVRAEPSADDAGQGEQARKLVWILPRLEPNEEKHFKVTIRPTTSATEFLSHATATFSVASSLRIRVTQPHLTLTQVGPETVPTGEAAPFKVQVTNTGNGAATHVVLRERLPFGLQHPQGQNIEADLGTLAAGATRQITLATTACKGGHQVIQASVTADDGLEAITQCSVNVTQASLFLHVTGPGRRLINREADFELELINTGSAAATGVQVSNALPEGFEFVSASQGGTFDGKSRSVRWKVGALPPGAKKSMGMKLLTRAAGDQVNCAVAQADGGLVARADASVRCEGIPALMLEAVDLEDPIEVGGETTYEIRVVNQGTAPSTGVRITATIPEGMTFRDASGPVPYHVHQQEVVFDSVSRLAAHADCLFRIRVVGKEDGDWRFKARLTCDQLRSPVHKEESTRVYKE